MEKHTLFLGRSEAGIFAQGLEASMEKTAGVPGPAWETAPSIRQFIKTLTPKLRKDNCYVLVNALGAGEYFGSNINADYFPWNALAHEGDDYGYKTFLNAHIFAHHVNKDPLRAFGVPVVSVLNPRMKRVELVVQLNRQKAREEGADGIIVRIDNGEFPDVSMGCKVPYDICSICGQRSKTKDDYCQHMRPPPEMRGIWGPNRILKDGSKIYVINTLPRFFDLSFVFIGADKTAKVMAKIASRGAYVCLGDVCAIPAVRDTSHPALYGPAGEALQLTKTAAADTRAGLRGECGRLCAECDECDDCHSKKLAAAFGATDFHKLADIVKSIPAGTFAARKLPLLADAEPDLPEEVLDAMAEKPLPSALGTATRAGMVLKPHEFQRLVLLRMGERDTADELDRSRQVFRHVHSFDDGRLEMDELVEEILDRLIPLLMHRTAFGPHFRIRVIRLGGEGAAKKTLPTREPLAHPLLDKISAAYNGYRRNVLMKLSQARNEVSDDSRLREAILGNGLMSMFSKTAGTEPIVDLDSVAYMLSAHLPNPAMLSTTAVAEAIAVANPWLREELAA